jgi:glycogen synthase
MLARFGLQAASAARSFSWDTAASQFLELYECLVSEEFTELCTC